MQEKVYIIILNYKGWKDTLECLESVLKQNYSNYQIILVDNSPTIESVDNIEKWAKGELSNIKSDFTNLVFPLVEKPVDYKIINSPDSEKYFYNEKLLIIKTNENKGYAAGNNIGLKYALRKNDYEYCWLLNNDTVVEKNSLLNAINYFKLNDRLGLLGSRLMYYNEPLKIQALGGRINYKFSTCSHVREGEFYKEGNVSIKIDYTIGASMFVSAKCLSKIGLMYEGFFLYYEEIDWAERAKINNFNIDIANDSIVFHKEGSTIQNVDNISEFGDLTSLKSRILFAKRNNKKNLYTTYLGFFIVVFNRLKRFQFKRVVKIFKLLFKNEI